jgi:hypothetical protein
MLTIIAVVILAYLITVILAEKIYFFLFLQEEGNVHPIAIVLGPITCLIFVIFWVVFAVLVVWGFLKASFED